MITDPATLPLSTKKLLTEVHAMIEPFINFKVERKDTLSTATQKKHHNDIINAIESYIGRFEFRQELSHCAVSAPNCL